jgi:large subunit ribosomal protein L4
MKLLVKDCTGKNIGREVDLIDSIFAIEPNDHAVYLDVKSILANRRQGTHKSKDRSEVSGSTRKLKKQKGTGGARAGDIKSPLFKGGGRVFGPDPRDYGIKVNKKVKILARKSALSSRASKGAITVIKEFIFDTHKTKNFINFLNSFDCLRKKNLVILAKNEKNVVLSSRNIRASKVITVSNINTFDILNADNIFIVETALLGIINYFSNNDGCTEKTNN